MKHWTFQEFLRIAKEKHGEKYDYSDSFFATIASKLIIACPVHGKFTQSAHDHVRGHGCRKCYHESRLTWSETDDNFLRDNFPTKGSAWCGKYLERTSLAVNQRCIKLDIKKNRKREKCIEGEMPNRFWNSLISRSREHNIEVNIIKEDLKKLFIKQNKKCALTGWDIKFGCEDIGTTASVDRIDSNKGYIHGNIQFVHKTVNRCKSWYSEEDFYKICAAVYLYRKDDLLKYKMVWEPDILNNTSNPTKVYDIMLNSESQTKRSYLVDKKDENYQ